MERKSPRNRIISFLDGIGISYLINKIPGELIAKHPAYEKLERKFETISQSESKARSKLERAHKSLNEQRRQYEELQSRYRGKVLELAKVRIGRGEDASSFNCPEAAAELARERGIECAELRERVSSLEHECAELKDSLNIQNSRFTSALLRFIQNADDRKNKTYGVVYIDNERKIRYVSREAEKLLRESDLIGKRAVYLLKKIPMKNRKKLIKDAGRDKQSYRKISFEEEENYLDVMLQRIGLYEENSGMIIYMRSHRAMLTHRSETKLINQIEAAHQDLKTRPDLGLA